MTAPACELCGRLNPVTITGEIVQHWCEPPFIAEPLAEWEKDLLATTVPFVARSLDDLRVGQVIAVRPRVPLTSDFVGLVFTVIPTTLERGAAQWFSEHNIVVLEDAPPADPVMVAALRLHESMSQHGDADTKVCGICAGFARRLLDAIEAAR